MQMEIDDLKPTQNNAKNVTMNLPSDASKDGSVLWPFPKSLAKFDGVRQADVDNLRQLP